MGAPFNDFPFLFLERERRESVQKTDLHVTYDILLSKKLPKKLYRAEVSQSEKKEDSRDEEEG